MNNYENLGIPDSGLMYHKVLPHQNSLSEFRKTLNFFDEIIDKRFYPNISLDSNNDIKIQFINYGDTQLVYILYIGNKKYTMLVGQPSAKFGTVKKEYDNLNVLSLKNPNTVIHPINYVCNKDRELYFSPYLMQARCIASQDLGWGIYIPEPRYHFKSFCIEDNEKSIVNSCIIATLIKLFNSDLNLGLSACKIGGGDFILEKEWSNEKLSHENTLKRLKLIAARELIKINLEDYIELIRFEFSKRTYYTDESSRDKSIIINTKSRVSMTKNEIEEGILLGRELRKYN